MTISVPENIDSASLEVRGQFPGSWWNEDQTDKRENRVTEIREKLSNTDCVGIVDTDSDGRACEVVLNAKYEKPVVIAANGGEYGISFSHALEIISEELNDSDVPVVIADLSPDSTFSAFQASVNKVDNPVYIYDHHEWSEFARMSMETVADEIVIGDDKCAAQVLQEQEYPQADDNLIEFLEVTADHDLWIKEDDRSEHISTLAFALPRDEYVQAALEFGADMVSECKRYQGIYGETIRDTQMMTEKAIENAEWMTINGHKIAITYFNCHQSSVGDSLLENGADLAVIIQPTLSVSFRSTEDFDRSEELARGLGGGGHKTAAGASLYNKIDFSQFSLDNISQESLYFSSIDESPPDVESLSNYELVWRTGGDIAVEFMKDYLRGNI